MAASALLRGLALGRGGVQMISELRFQISDSRFQISDFKFQIPDSRFQISGFGFQISELRFQISDFKFAENLVNIAVFACVLQKTL